MTADKKLTNPEVRPSGCSIVILYDTQQALTRATSLCERIVTQFWEDLDIHLAHWALDTLMQKETGDEAAARAAVADIVVVVASSSGEFPAEFIAWTERWLGRRQHREGALVGLLEPVAGKQPEATLREIQLHRLALRAGMDYLNQFPQTPLNSIPDATNWCASRAETVTGTLDKIIRIEPQHPHR